MNQNHEIPTTDRDRDMFYDLQKLLVPVDYYAKLHPTDYEQEEAERRAKEEAKQKAAEAKKAAEEKKAAAPKKEAAAAETKVVSAEAAAPSEPDDLERIEGIGPKLSQVLQAAGIKTFEQLAETEVDRLKQILEEADPKLLRLADPATWSRQAKLAAAGKWDALERWQERLRGGKEG
jgi:predicted flap endonuclease-1-like 5' DNA nuclease